MSALPQISRVCCVPILLLLTVPGSLCGQDASNSGSAKPADAVPAEQFTNDIAPLLARHCLECHDATTQEGGLDLSRKRTALKGGDTGKVIVPGSSDDSLLWQYVANDDMPLDRPALSPQEKERLREWIDSGATWTGEVIEPADFLRDDRVEFHVVRRLTVAEYIETVRSAVGVNIEPDARRLLPRDVRADGFSNTAYNLNVDLQHVQAYSELAEIVVRHLDVPAFADRYTQSRDLSDDNMRRLIAGMGKWLLRGPLDGHETESYLRLSSTIAKEGRDFEETAGAIIEAMLQSPRFLYHIENQRGDGTRQRLSNYELASRLSYILWGGPPDEELLQAADAGKLFDQDAVEAQVRRMLSDPRAVERSSRFVHEWLNLGRLDHLKPNEERFPKWDPQLATDMQAESLEFFHEIAWEQGRPLADLMNAQVTFVTPRLARHYGLDAKDETASRPGLLPPRAFARDENRGLVVRYSFRELDGATVRDESGDDNPLDLKIADLAHVRWTKVGLHIERPTLISGTDLPARLSAAIKNSNALTLEAWITPADTKQSGPARILSFSSGTSQRNFTLGQDGDRFEVRLRSSRTDRNGLPPLASPKGTAKVRSTYVVFSRDATGRTKLYIDGELQAAGHADGDLSNWDDGYNLVLANESTGDRPWLGTLSEVAIYSRALSAEEIQAKCQTTSRYDLAEVPSRGGLLTQGSILTVGGDEASMVTRGLFVLRDLLYSEIGDPPPCVDTTPVPTGRGLSQRAIAEARLADSSCAGCHSKFEPLAFGLEKFDGVGEFHELDEHGNTLRDDGEIRFPGDAEPVSYDSSAEFMDLLAGSERIKKNFTRKVTQFAIGRPLVPSDEPIIEEIHQAAQNGGGTYKSLIAAVVMSELVKTVPTENNQ